VTPTADTRQVRLGLVFNGGVSLAVWMGGVTQEIDAARRAEGSGTSHLYGRLNAILRQKVRVDIVAGASAGGINGALLAAAIAAGKPVPNLRETWITLGDLSSLVRAPARADPPSLLQGDAIVLKAVRDELDDLLGAGADPRLPQRQPLYLYVTATNIYGRRITYTDSTGREFAERDSRHVFSFESRPSVGGPGTARSAPPPSRLPPPPTDEKVAWPMRAAGPTAFQDADVTTRLAAAARASSSFPGAFEAAGPLGPDGEWFIDGGVLDNQPFVPVLDRIAVLPADGLPVKRVVGYIVPYVTEPAPKPAAGTAPAKLEQPSALKTVAAGFTLPRALPKLVSLDRVTADDQAQRAAADHRRLIQSLLVGSDAQLKAPADELFTFYRRTRWQATGTTFKRWAAGDFVPGDGVVGQYPAIAVADLAAPGTATWPSEPRPETPWIAPAPAPAWPAGEPEWRWGLSPAERVATWALLVLRDRIASHAEADDAPPGSAARQALADARRCASELVWHIRTLKGRLSESFAVSAEKDLFDRAQWAYSHTEPLWLQQRFEALDALLDTARDAIAGPVPMPGIQTLLYIEVISNAVKIDEEGPPFPFDFIFMSAGIANSLEHEFTTPEEKLAGMKLGHFGGFVKRSWRANDWLWGRLDGVEHVLRATVDREQLATLAGPDRADDAGAEDLAMFAFETVGGDGRPRPSPALSDVWARNVKRSGLTGLGPSQPDQFKEALKRAISDDPKRDAALDLCRAGLAARIELEILRDELPVVATEAEADLKNGAARAAAGGLWAHTLRKRQSPDGSLGETELVPLFRRMQIGAEPLSDEMLSKAGLDVAGQTTAVTAAALVGARGGLPMLIRGGLKALRAGTLVLSYLVRLLARSPAAGISATGVLCLLAYIATQANGGLLGTLATGLVMLAVVMVAVVLVVVTGILGEQRATLVRVLGFVAVAGVPGVLGTLAFVDVHDARKWAMQRSGEVPTTIAGGIALATAAAALVAAGLYVTRRATPIRWANWLVNGYRILFTVGVLVAGVGVLIERYGSACAAKQGEGCDGIDWRSLADERAGTWLVVLLLVTLLFVALFVETAAGIRTRRARREAREAKAETEAEAAMAEAKSKAKADGERATAATGAG
jgi:predicted acylesterase/phospholipase RssA